MAVSERTALESSYAALTEGCGLVDRSERGKLSLSGPGAVEFLEGQVTNELTTLPAGQGCYAAFLTHKGKMLGDLRILAVGPALAKPPAELWLDTERVALQALFDMITRYKIGYQVELHKQTLERGLLSLIGPRTRAVVEDRATFEEPLGEQEHFHVAALIARRPVRLVATGRPLGVDVICQAADTEAVAAALEAGGASPVEEQAAEVVRVESGTPRYGVDLDDTVIPQEAGLNARAVSFTKGCYVGQETVARLHYKGKPNRHLRGLRLSAPLPAPAELELGDRHLGRLTSSVLSPSFGAIGLALLRKEAQPGARLDVRASSQPGITAEVVELPFR